MLENLRGSPELLAVLLGVERESPCDALELAKWVLESLGRAPPVFVGSGEESAKPSATMRGCGTLIGRGHI